ncbi:MAG: tRNA-specific adenosine deaminase, partial [Clostridia bacterium]|nr:tRNA-specific adenosine deaminase [Clostridia bacterium]
SRIRRLVYGASDSKAGSCGSVINLFDLPYNHKPEVISGFMADECGSLLSGFFTQLRERKKSE